MNFEDDDADYVGGGTPINAIPPQQPQQPQQQFQGNPQESLYQPLPQQYNQQQPHMQMKIPQQYDQQQHYYPQQQQMQTQAQVLAPTKDFKYYCNVSPLEVFVLFIIFIIMSNSAIYAFEKGFIPYRFSSHENPPIVLVIFNALIFVLVYVLLKKFAFK